MYTKWQTMTDHSSISRGERENVFPTGSLRLDRALGRGGLPQGAIVEIIAPEASGKTTLALHITAEAQKRGKRCLWFDCDGTLTPEFAKSRGVDERELFFAQSEDAGFVMSIIHTIIQADAFDLLVVDSLSHLFPNITHYETDSFGTGEWHRHLPAWLHSLNANLERQRSTIVFTRTLLQPPHPIYQGLASNLERLALNLHASVRLRLEVLKTLMVAHRPYGWRARVHILKNENIPCSEGTNIDIIYNKGIDQLSEMLALGIEHGVVEEKADGYYYRHQFLGATLQHTKEHLRKDQTLQQELEASIRLELF